MRIVIYTLVALLPTVLAAGSENWPQFRGPDGDGHANAAHPPQTWSETSNIAWKRPIHGRGWSSPVIWKNQIWVTTATEGGRQLFALCIDRDSGETVFVPEKSVVTFRPGQIMQQRVESLGNSNEEGG